MTEQKHDDARGASRSDDELGWTLYDNLDQGSHPLACAVRDNAKKEIDQLREALKKANEQAEHFEREWYLRGDAIEALLACPSGMYCDGYPVAEKQARALLVPNDQGNGPRQAQLAEGPR